MTEESRTFRDDPTHPEHEHHESVLYTNAMEAMEAIEDLDDDLAKLETEDLSYWMANSITFSTLHGLLVIEDRVAHRPSHEDEIHRLGDQLFSHLPLDREQRAQLMRGITKDGPTADATRWYEQLSDPDLLLVEKWRRWLDLQFDEEQQDDPESQGRQLRPTLQQLSTLLDNAASR
jgi:hypothetical protein